MPRIPQNDQRAGSVGLVLLVVELGIQAFAVDVKFKLFMPGIRPHYCWLHGRNNQRNYRTFSPLAIGAAKAGEPVAGVG